MEFDTKHVREFLNKISRDREQEIRSLEDQAFAECERVRADAHETARNFFTQTVERVRLDRQLERERSLSRVRAELRRRRWEALKALQQRALDRVRERMAEAWRDADRQWSWCTFWLDVARHEAGPQPLRVVLGRGALEATRQRLMQTADPQSTVQVEMDPSQQPGLMICWQQYILDGTLDSLNAAITEAVLRELAAALHNDRSRGGDAQ